MAIEIADLTQLDPALVSQEAQEATSRVQELHPELDLRRGVLHDLVIQLHAILTGATRTNLNRYLSARSLKQIEADPTLADNEITEDVLSNWRLERQVGTKARGEVVVVMSRNTTLTLSRGRVFIANGLTYYTTQLFSAVANAGLMDDPADRLFTTLTDGNYAFTVEVEAAEVGAEYALTKDTLILPEEQPAAFVTSYVASNFMGGTDTETNDEMLRRLQQGIAAKGGSNRVNMNALLRQMDDFAEIPATSVVGYGDAEMLRDRHTIFPLSFGGRVDWYIRGQSRLYRFRVIKSCVLVAKDNSGHGTWQFSLSRAEVAGFYEVRNIRPESSDNLLGGCTLISDTRSNDLTGSGFKPDIDNIIEGAYTAYQTAIIVFHDPLFDASALSLGSTKNYDVEVVGTALVGELQDLLASFSTRHRAADILVRAAVPCFVKLNFTIYKQAGEPTPDLNGIKAALVTLVNSIGFIGRLYASRITDVVHTYLLNDTSIGEIDMLGRIRRPDGTTLYLRDDEVLQIEDDPANLVTANTVQFFLETEDIGITVMTGVPTPV